MAISREVFEQFGGFDVNLGRIGVGSLLSNEEIALMERLPEGSRFYVSEAWVDHLIPKERTEQKWFRNRAFWQAISDRLANKVDRGASRYHFDRFSEELPLVPAQHRSLRALCYRCETADQFERQIKMIYDIAVSMSLGQEDLQ
jgi:hypothetical protein